MCYTAEPEVCDQDTEYTCRDGQCVPLVYRCNGRVECRDSSDESNCRELFYFLNLDLIFIEVHMVLKDLSC